MTIAPSPPASTTPRGSRNPVRTRAYAGSMPAGGSRKVRAARRRAQRMRRVEHDLSDEQWAALTLAWGGCAYCGVTGTPLQRDCVLALSRGGRYTLDNIVPACRACN